MLEYLVDLANAMARTLDGSFAQVRGYVDGADVAFAVWQDPDRPHGVGFLLVKGESLWHEARAAHTAREFKAVSVPCSGREQATQLQAIMGEARESA